MGTEPLAQSPVAQEKKVIAVDNETRYEHGKKFTPLLQELGAAGTNLTRAQVVIPNLLLLI